jgi:hypothetical protein
VAIYWKNVFLQVNCNLASIPLRPSGAKYNNLFSLAKAMLLLVKSSQSEDSETNPL